jgi:hypothetical protein
MSYFTSLIGFLLLNDRRYQLVRVPTKGFTEADRQITVVNVMLTIGLLQVSTFVSGIGYPQVVFFPREAELCLNSPLGIAKSFTWREGAQRQSVEADELE